MLHHVHNGLAFAAASDGANHSVVSFRSSTEGSRWCVLRSRVVVQAASRDRARQLSIHIPNFDVFRMLWVQPLKKREIGRRMKPEEGATKMSFEPWRFLCGARSWRRCAYHYKTSSRQPGT